MFLEVDLDGETTQMDHVKILEDQVCSGDFALMLRTEEFILKKLNAETNIDTCSVQNIGSLARNSLSEGRYISKISHSSKGR
jgi:hypothetical protein